MHWPIISSTLLLINLFDLSESDSYRYKNGQELILCRKCGADIADSSYIITKQSPSAQELKLQNLFGQKNVTTQLLTNPFGISFEVVTIEKAKCQNIGRRQGADSWFPEHTWRLCSCPHCGQHLGWTFENMSSDNGSNNVFHGLIVANILGENFTDSLIMMPSYKL